jgi:hypothetical protein
VFAPTKKEEKKKITKKNILGEIVKISKFSGRGKISNKLKI